MDRRGWMIAALLLAAPTTRGGARIELAASPGYGGNCCPPTTFPPGSQVDVDISLIQNPGGADQLLRMIELDLALSSALNISFPVTHDRGTAQTSDDIRFWRFDSLSGCRSAPDFCGFSHYLDDDLPAGTVDTRANLLSMAFYGIAADPSAQLLLRADGTPLPIGRLRVTLPPVNGVAVLNVMNAADPDALNRRARVDFGFDTHRTWRAGWAAPNELTGGTLTFNVGICGECPCTLNSSTPPFTPVGPAPVPTNGTLWRTTRHVIRLRFEGFCFLGPPTPGQMLIQEMLPGGAFGPDLSENFVYTVEFGNVLRIREPSPTGTVLSDNKWYAIRNAGGWPGMAAFEAQWPVNVGDFDGNRFTTATDVSAINSAPEGAQADQSRADINGDGFKTATDVSLANSHQGPPPVKPSGH